MCKKIIKGICFVLIFVLIFTAASLIYIPKWKPDTEKNPAEGIYYEEDNSIDVLMLGSCNMYTSFCPVLFYDEYGITSYDKCCPDQSLVTSYYYLKNTLRKQSPKVVVLEALFLMEGDGGKREYYNRLAIDYMPMSIERLQLINATVGNEVEVMQARKSNSPGKLLTYAGYLFPLLRYHSREDLSKEDIDYYFTGDRYSDYKGSIPYFNYTNVNGLHYDMIHNGDCIREDAKEYLPKIAELCKENGIEFFVMKSPNKWRWNDEYAATAREFVESQGIDFVDSSGEGFSQYYDYDVQSDTGRLNIYGMKKLTSEVGGYIVDKYGLAKTELSQENTKKWDACVENLYRTCADKGFYIDECKIAQLKNVEEGISLRWNPSDDCSKYEIYRSEAGQGYKLIDVQEGPIYIDTDVENGIVYNYYIVPTEGAHKGEKSNEKGRAFVEAPKNVTAEYKDGNVVFSWENDSDVDYFSISEISPYGYHYYNPGYTKSNTYTDTSVSKSTEVLSYRIYAVKKMDGVSWESSAVIVYP